MQLRSLTACLLGFSLANPVLACMTVTPRGQFSLFTSAGEGSSRDVQPPVEQHLFGGDLLTIIAPKDAVFSVLPSPNVSDTSDPALVALDEQRYRALSAQGRDGPLADTGLLGLTGTTWHRFGAAHPGVAYVKYATSSEQYLVRVEILPKPPVERGEVKSLSEADRNTLISLSYYDTVNIELPGNVADGWTVLAGQTTGIRLVSIQSAKNEAGGDKPDRVRLQFQPSSTKVTDTLTINSTNGSFVFKIQLRPTPTC